MAFQDNDNSANKVLDYYEKFSQNSNLPKYFSGSSIQYLPVDDVPTRRNDPNAVKLTSAPHTLISTSFTIPSVVDCVNENILDSKKICEHTSSNKDGIDIGSNKSPVSESPDNKRLEWDSGADIGYIFQNSGEKKILRKCLSLPSLKDAKLNLNVSNSTTTIGNDNFKLFILSSTPDCTSLNQEFTESSSISSDLVTKNNIKQVFGSDLPSTSSTNVSKIKSSQESSSNSESGESELLDFRMTLSYLKERIGLPGANSTPDVQCIKNQDFLDSRKPVASFISKNLTRKHIAYHKENPVDERHVDCSLVSQVLKKNVEMQIKKQPFCSKNKIISLTNCENEDIPKKATKRLNEKVIELSVSTPVSLDWTCTEVVEDKLVKVCRAVPKAVQTEGILELILNSSVDQIKGVNKHPPTFVDREITNKPKDYSDCASNCDSFEYIRSGAADIKSEKEKKILQQSENKYLCNLEKLSDKSTISNRSDEVLKVNSAHAVVNLNGSFSNSVSEDIEKHVDLLQKLLTSKKLNSNKKKYYIKKLIKGISDFDYLDSNTASSDIFFLRDDKDKKRRLKDSTVPHKESTKGGNHNTNVISSSEDDFTYSPEDKAHSEYSTRKQWNPDYLLEFAENERAYQINWINNEITHLSKLKSVLELKDCKIFNKKKKNPMPFQKHQNHPLKTSVYKIVQESDIGKNSEKNYVIQTKVDASIDKKINYCLEGKKYSVTKHKVSQTGNSNKDFVENSVTADIKIQSEENQTYIQVGNLYNACKQVSCVCQSCKPSNLNMPENSTENILETGVNLPELKCVCKSAKIIETNSVIGGYSDSSNPSTLTKAFTEKFNQKTNKESHLFPDSPADLGHDLPEQFNSLQNIFHRCCCTIEAKKCSCIFVKKLYRRFLPNENIQVSKNMSSGAHNIKTDLVPKDNESQATPLPDNVGCRERVLKNSFQKDEIQNTLGSNHDRIRSSKHLMHLEMPNTTHTKVQVKAPPITECINQSENSYNHKKEGIKIINDEKHLIAGSNKLIHNDIVVGNSERNYACVGKVDSPNVKLKEPTLPDMIEQSEFTHNLSVTRAKDHSPNFGLIINTKYKDIGVQAVPDNCHENLQSTEDFMPLVISKTTQTAEIVEKPSTKQWTSESEYTSEYKESKTNINDEKHLFTSENKSTKKNIAVENISQNSTRINKIPSVESMPDSKQQNKQTNRKGVTRKKDSDLSFASIINSKYKDISVQASVGLKNHSSQTSGEELDKKIYNGKENTFFEDQSNNADTKLKVDRKDNINNKLSTKQARESLDIKNNKNILDNKSGRFCPESSKDKNLLSASVQCTTVSKDEPASEGTFANYSQSGSTSASISTSVFDSQSIPLPRLTCIFCKKKAFIAEVWYVQDDSSSYAICSKCYYNKSVCSDSNCQHKCKSLKLLETGKTSTYDQFCKHCKLNSMKTSSISKGVAYNLTLQEPNKKKKHITNVGLKKLNAGRSNDRKSEKNKENSYKTKIDMYTGESKNAKCKTECIKDFDTSQPEPSKKSKTQYTLTDYLIINRPEFICSAEYRRQIMLNSRIFREHHKDISKLHFLESNLNSMADKGQHKLFTEREMKEITKKNYQKLPEYQNKINNIQKKYLRDADKLISDIFAKNVQKSVLKGQRNFPIDKPVTNLYKKCVPYL